MRGRPFDVEEAFLKKGLLRTPSQKLFVTRIDRYPPAYFFDKAKSKRKPQSGGRMLSSPTVI